MTHSAGISVNQGDFEVFTPQERHVAVRYIYTITVECRLAVVISLKAASYNLYVEFLTYMHIAHIYSILLGLSVYSLMLWYCWIMSYRLATPTVSNTDDLTEFKDSFVATNTSFFSLTCDGGSILKGVW